MQLVMMGLGAWACGVECTFGQRVRGLEAYGAQHALGCSMHWGGRPEPVEPVEHRNSRQKGARAQPHEKRKREQQQQPGICPCRPVRAHMGASRAAHLLIRHLRQPAQQLR